MKKKVLSMMLAGAMTVSMLAGCGAGSDEAATTDNTAADTKTETAGTTEAGGGTAEASGNPVTLRTVSMFGGTDPNKETYEAINKEFMEQYDYITIEDNSQTSDEEWKAAVNADFSVGNEPDVIQFFTDATADSIIATDKLVSIEDIRAEYPDYAADTLDSALQAAANTDGVERAVPTTGYWEGLYCNKDLFDQYDLELPTDWASMETAIETFKENDIIPIACSLNNVPHYWIEFPMLYASGVDEYTSIPTSAPEGWVKGLEMFKTLRDMGAFPEDTDTVDDAYTGQLFRDKESCHAVRRFLVCRKHRGYRQHRCDRIPGCSGSESRGGLFGRRYLFRILYHKEGMGRSGQERCSSEIRHGTHLPGRRSEILGSNRRRVPGSC